MSRFDDFDFRKLVSHEEYVERLASFPDAIKREGGKTGEVFDAVELYCRGHIPTKEEAYVQMITRLAAETHSLTQQIYMLTGRLSTSLTASPKPSEENPS